MSIVHQYRRTEREQPALPTSSSSSSSSTSTTSKQLCQKDAAVRIACEGLREKYAECIGRPMPAAIHRRLLLDLIDGAPYAYYSYALDEASMAPAPSWRYVMAIVGRLTREQVPPEDLAPL